MLGVLAVGALVGCIILIAHRARDAEKNGWLPLDYRTAPVAYAEKTFRSRRRKIVARVDRAYRDAGVIRLVELKTRKRHRVYRSDIIELSAQRIAIQDDTGEVVSRKALVVTQVNGERRSHTVELLPVEEVVALQDKHRRILDGSVMPAYAKHGATCDGCAFRKECRPENRESGRH